MSAEQPHHVLQQRPAGRVDPLPPGGVEAREPHPEQRRIDLVEDEAPPAEIVLQAGIERRLLDALPSHEDGDVALDGHAHRVAGRARSPNAQSD